MAVEREDCLISYAQEDLFCVIDCCHSHLDQLFVRVTCHELTAVEVSSVLERNQFYYRCTWIS